MLNETEKLARFKAAVNTEAEGKVNKILSEAETEKRARLDKAEKSIEDYKRSEIQRIDKEERQRFTREVSAAELETQREILLHRCQLADKVFENVEERLAQYRMSGEYEQWLLSAAVKAKSSYSGESGTFYVSPTDMKYGDKIKNSTGFDVQPEATILLGGIMLRLENINVLLDGTFDSAVEEEKRKFCRTAGLSAEQE